MSGKSKDKIKPKHDNSFLHQQEPACWKDCSSCLWAESGLKELFTYDVVVLQPLNYDPMNWALQASLSFTVPRSLLKHMSVELMPSSHLLLCHPLLFLPSIFPSIRGFSNKVALFFRWPKDWSFSINPSNEYSELIFFRIDWFGLLAVQGTLKSLLQHHSSKASILWCQPSLRSNSHICTWLMEKPWSWLNLCWQSKVSAF